VLVVDDDETSLAIVGARLSALGASVELASDGREAVAAFRTRLYDLVLTDYSMPGLNGAEAIRRMRILEPPGGRVPMFVMTSANADAVHRECREAGADLILDKGAGAAEICRIVEEQLERSTDP